MRDDALLALQLWRDAEHGAPWRARLTDLRGNAVATFADVPALLSYLSDAFGAEAGAATGVGERAPTGDGAAADDA